MEKMSKSSLYYFGCIEILLKVNSVIFKTAETRDKSVLLQVNKNILAVIETSQHQLIAD